MRPAIFQVGGVLYWVIQTRNPDTMVLKDADSTPSVAVRKNGASVGDSATITKRAATTGIYDCSYNPAAEVEGDAFTLEESATVTGTTTSSATYTQTWNTRVVAVERGTDGANTTAPATPTNVSDAQTAILAKLPAALESGRIAAALDSAGINAIADQVWDEATSGHTTSGTYGGRIVRATNSNVEVQITGSYHIAADVHEFQSGVITAGDFAANSLTASALATDAVAEIQSGLATASALATQAAKINKIEAATSGTVTGAGTSTEVFVGPSATLTITVDSSGNRSAVVVT